MISFNQFSGPASQAAAGTNTFAVTSTTGNLLALALYADRGVTITGITDNKGNFWILNPASGGVGFLGFCQLAYCFGAATGVNSIQIFSTGSGRISIGLYDCGSASGGSLGAISGHSGNVPFGHDPSQQINPPGAGIVISVMSFPDAMTAVASPFTLEAMDCTSTAAFVASAYDVNSGPGLLTSTFTSTAGSQEGGVIAAFAEATPAATPTFTPGAGSFTTPQFVTLACATPGATITYTTDGSTPVPGSNGSTYTGPISVPGTETINAVASAPGFTNSAVGTAAYTIGGSATPNLGIGHLVSGQNQPEITVNEALDALDDAANLEVGLAMADADFTLTQQQLGSGAVISMTGTLTAGRHINLPTLINRVFVFENATTGGFSLTVQVTGVPGTTVGVAASAGLVILFSDGTNIEQISGGGGGGGSVPNFADAETPSGTINGVNKTFTLANAPSPAASLILAHATASSGGGAVLKAGGADFTLSGAGISMVNAPATGDSLLAWYRH